MAGAAPTINARIRVQGMEDVRAQFRKIGTDFKASADQMRQSGAQIGQSLSKSTSGISSTFKSLGTIGSGAFKVISTAASGLTWVISNTVKAALSLTTALGGIAIKAGVLGAAAWAGVQAFGYKTGEALEAIGRQAGEAGLSVEAFSKISSAMRLTGGSAEDLVGGLQSLNGKLVEAAKDAGSGAAGAFAQLGLSVRNADGSLKNTEQVLSEVADGLSMIQSDTLRTAAAVDLFGGSGTRMLPILAKGSKGLKEYSDQAQRLGTTVTKTQADTAKALMEQSRRVAEALRGVSYKIAESLLPFLTKNADSLSKWIATNGDKVAAYAAKLFKEISGIGADFAALFAGNSFDVERTWIFKLRGPVEFIRKLALDLIDLLSGDRAARLPWLHDIGDSILYARDAFLALASSVARAIGIARKDLPTVAEAARWLRDALANLVAGIQGRVSSADWRWVNDFGRALDGLAKTVGALAGTLNEHKGPIAAFAADALHLVVDAMQAIRSLLKGDQVSDNNSFSWLNAAKEQLIAFAEEARKAFIKYKHDAIEAFKAIQAGIETLWAAMDKIAKWVGLENATQLLLVLSAIKFSGLGAALTAVLGLINGVLLAINGVWALTSNLLGLLVKFGAAVGTYVIAPIAAAIGISTGLLVAIVAVVAGLVAAIWYFWDDIKSMLGQLGTVLGDAFQKLFAWFGELWDGIAAAGIACLEAVMDAWEGLVTFMSGLWDTVLKAATDFWNAMKALPGQAWDALVKSWDGVSGWFKARFDDVRKIADDLWDGLKSAPGKVVDTIKSAFAALPGIVQGVVDGMLAPFTWLWDKIKGGFTSVKDTLASWFGFGGGDNAAASDGSSGDNATGFATGGIVRGAGSGTSDSIRAWLSNGEGVIRAGAVQHYGESLIHALNGLSVPKTAFATGGIAGQQAPVAASGNPLSLVVNGQTIRGLSADASASQELRKRFRRAASSSTSSAPRWRGY